MQKLFQMKNSQKINKKLLKLLYLTKGLTQQKISDIFHCSQSYIFLLMKKFQIKTRPLSAHLTKHGLTLKPHPCKDCGKPTSDYRKERCWKCYLEHNKTTKLKLVYECEICGNPIVYLAKFKWLGLCKYCACQLMGIKRLGKNSSSYKNGKYCKRNCIDCNTPIARGKTTKRCRHCFQKYYGTKRQPIKPIFYNKQKFRSSWEANFAKWCDLSGIKWQYEPKTFDLGNTTYTPDFYLPDFNCWIEIKGRWFLNSKDKVKIFWKIFKNEELKLLEYSELKVLGII